MSSLLVLLAITFHPVTVKDLPTTAHTHVHVCGVVTLSKKEADGDRHLRISDPSSKTRFVVAEIIPAIRLSAPAVGQHVCVDGISREDKQHKWYEVHPVLRWRVDSGR